jgi:streptogramin lyase
MKLAAVLLASAAVAGSLPGAHATKVCAAAGPRWPTMTLALRGTSAWVACKEQQRIIRVDTRTGKTLKTVRLGGQVIAVVSAYSSIWALEDFGSLNRVNPSTGKVRRITLGASAPYNIWIGAGSVWVADDQGASVLRISPRTNKVVARIPVGDGPASMAFNGASAWVMNHRDRILTRIDLATNTAKTLRSIAPEDVAPERMVWANDSLWITGRGADLLQVNPTTGAVEKTIEIGGSGVDLAVSGGALWIPTRSAEVDRTGFPTMDALKRVSIDTGAVTVVARSTGRVDVHGLVAAGGAVWIADNTAGRLYRVAAR